MFRFPLWLGLWGAVLPIVTFLEGMMPLILMQTRPMRARDWQELGDLGMLWARYGVAVGVVLGLVASGFCVVRRGRAGSTYAKRFELNLRWCLAFAFLVIGVNDLVFWGIGQAMGGMAAFTGGPLRAALLFPLAVSTVLNLVAVVWATTHTITSDDVLTLRVLMGKLRRSARLES